MLTWPAISPALRAPRSSSIPSQARSPSAPLPPQLSPAAAEYLIEKGYSPDFGARPLRRVIEHEIEDPLSEDLLRGVFLGAASVTVNVKDGKLAFDAEAVPAPQQSAPLHAAGQALTVPVSHPLELSFEPFQTRIFWIR